MDFTTLAFILCILYPIRYFLDLFKVRLSSKAMQYVSLFLSGSLLALFSLFLGPLLPKVLYDVVEFLRTHSNYWLLLFELFYVGSIGIGFVKSLQFLVKDIRQLIVK
ncbi:hypothetical protein [Enterococcus faecalis]|uniref:hypothetical protein n=1 Tax=Enterococcus faecalis TaxID=1351 RepID=UPI00080C4B37|nr:hypothetical protein [Enterococcus faecalis]ANU71928.1 hypothetical protein A4V06_02135 [Enterococcus faecalis]ASU26627.1 hypothetical protein ADH73_11460 [Enterococcus faecalis]MCO8259815.1 hypothetical protein [Enterococcus faecalis]MCP8907850.1 hypothetical protein [Enterococcus faecalis]MCP8910880.1 hypothetical protein [Enterococcus faecalis]